MSLFAVQFECFSITQTIKIKTFHFINEKRKKREYTKRKTVIISTKLKKKLKLFVSNKIMFYYRT